MRFKLGNHLFVKRSKYIRIKNPPHKQSEKPACASKRDVLELNTLRYLHELKLVQVILFEIDCAIFYTNLHELFCQFIS